MNAFKSSLITTLICLVLQSFAIGDQPKLPSPPEGFTWQWSEEAKVAVLQPTNWHFKTDAKKETQGVFVTKEEIDPQKGFETGLTLNAIPNISKTAKMKASEYAKKFVAEATRDKSKVLEVLPQKKAGPAETCGCRIKKDGSVTHFFLIADDKNDKLYLFFFESPEKEWDEAWKLGEQMMKKLYIDFPE